MREGGKMRECETRSVEVVRERVSERVRMGGRVKLLGK